MDRTRQVAIAGCALVILTLLPWLSAWLFLDLIGVQGVTPGALAIVDYWQRYAASPDYQFQLYVATFGPLAIPAAVAVLAIAGRPNTMYGDAHFASEAEVRRAGLRASHGLLLGKKGGQFLCAGGQAGAIMFAPPRSGKGVGFGVPNLLNWRGSALVTDIKLENYDITSGFRAKHGQQIVVFSPLDPNGRTHRYNPLDFVSQDPGRRINDLQKITFKLLPTPDRGDPMWSNEARDLLEGILLYLMDVRPPATIGNALRLTRSVPDFAGWLDDQLMEHTDELDDNCRLAFTGFLQKAPKEQSGVLSSLKGALSLWSNPLIDRATAASDFDPSQLRRRAMTIYVGVQPGDIGRLAPLVSVFLQQTFDSLLQSLPEEGEPHQVLALLDEFTAMGRLANVEKGIAYFASYNICLAPIIQDLTQLQAVYGDNVAKTFLATSKYRIAFAQNNDETASYISRQLGTKTIKTRSVSRSGGFQGDPWSNTVSEGFTGRELMLPHEIMQLDARKQLLMVERQPPVLARKIVYFKDRAFRGRVLPAVALPTPIPMVEPLKAPAVVTESPEAEIQALGSQEHRTASRVATEHDGMPSCRLDVKPAVKDAGDAGAKAPPAVDSADDDIEDILKDMEG